MSKNVVFSKVFTLMIDIMLNRDKNFIHYSIKGKENGLLSGLFLAFSSSDDVKLFSKGKPREFSFNDFDELYEILNLIASEDKATFLLLDKQMVLHGLRVMDFTDLALSKLLAEGCNFGLFDDVVELVYGKQVGTKRELALALALISEYPVFVMSQTSRPSGFGTLYWLSKYGLEYEVYVNKHYNLVVVKHEIDFLNKTHSKQILYKIDIKNYLDDKNSLNTSSKKYLNKVF